MAEAFNLSGIVGMDAGEFVSGADEAAGASEDVGDSADETSESLFELDSAGMAAGGAIAGVGTAMQAALDDTKQMRTQMNQAAVTTGLTSDEMTQLAADTATATTNLQSSSGILTTLAERGVTSQSELKSLSGEFRTLAEATGTDATVATQTAIQTMRAFGDEAGDISKNMDTLTKVTRTTSLDFDEFGEVVGDIQPVIDNLGLSMDDVASYMMALEEQGVNSQRAQELFAQAAESAEGDVTALNKELGVSQSALKAQREELKNADGVTREYANAANESASMMDHLKAEFAGLRLEAASMLQPVSAAIPAMQGLGVAAMGFSAINVSAVIPSIAGVMTALTPVLPIIIGLGAAAAALYAAWETNFLGIQNVTDTVFDALGDGVDWIVDKFTGGVDWIVEKVLTIPNVIGDVLDKIPGIDTEDIVGDIDTGSIADAAFPDKPGEEADETAAAAGLSTTEARQRSLDAGGGGPMPDAGDTTSPGEMDTGEFDGVEDAVAATGSDPGSSPPAASTSTSGGGRVEALLKEIRDRLDSGFELVGVDGTLDVDEDIATLDDIDAELRQIQTKQRNRGLRQ